MGNENSPKENTKKDINPGIAAKQYEINIFFIVRSSGAS